MVEWNERYYYSQLNVFLLYFNETEIHGEQIRRRFWIKMNRRAEWHIVKYGKFYGRSSSEYNKYPMHCHEFFMKIQRYSCLRIFGKLGKSHGLPTSRVLLQRIIATSKSAIRAHSCATNEFAQFTFKLKIRYIQRSRVKKNSTKILKRRRAEWTSKKKRVEIPSRNASLTCKFRPKVRHTCLLSSDIHVETRLSSRGKRINWPVASGESAYTHIYPHKRANKT